MFAIGGITCSEEFSAFLAANPTYVEIPAPEPGFETISQQIYICIDGGTRWYDTGTVSRFQEFINFLTANPSFGGLTDEGRIALGVTGVPTATLLDPGSGFFLFNYRDEFEYYIYFDPSIVGPENLAVLADNPTWTITL